MKSDILSLSRAVYPIYRVKAADIEEIDGIVFADGLVLDDKNVKRDTLGERRLLSSHRALLKLNKMYPTIREALSGKSGTYIDSTGKILEYSRTKFAKIVYHKIRNVEYKDTYSMLRVYGVNFSFKLRCPPPKLYTYAGILYLNNLPWLLWDYSKRKLPDRRMKV